MRSVFSLLLTLSSLGRLALCTQCEKTVLLQSSRGADLAMSTSPSEDLAGPWAHQWRTDTKIFPGPSLSEGQTEPTKAEIWRGLGENWWMVFLDGKDHWKGKHGYDHQEDKDQDTGSFLENEERMYDATFTSSDWDVRWNATKLAKLNARLRSLECKSTDCGDLFISNYDVAAGVGNRSSYLSAVVDRPLPLWSTGVERRSKMDQLLDSYYSHLDAVLMAEGGNRVAAFPHMVPYMLKMYSQLALLHPFGDGNSRTRTAFLQTELVMHGGHPIMLQENAWFVYWVGSMFNMQMEFLKGWCTWEIAKRTGSSPFLSEVASNATSLSQYNRSYNAASGACRLPE